MPSQLLVGGEVDLMLLAILSRGPLHGYAVIEALRQRSNGAFDLPEGTVYPALYRLERLGLVSSRTRTVQGRQRRLYELTKAGRAAVTERKRSWKRLVAGMAAVLGRV
jgi:PadR family transcriptional regulator, regulatory protein PadR